MHTCAQPHVRIHTKSNVQSLIVEVHKRADNALEQLETFQHEVSTRASINDLLERCEGIAAHEDDYYSKFRPGRKALRSQIRFIRSRSCNSHN